MNPMISLEKSMFIINILAVSSIHPPEDRLDEYYTVHMCNGHTFHVYREDATVILTAIKEYYKQK